MGDADPSVDDLLTPTRGIRANGAKLEQVGKAGTNYHSLAVSSEAIKGAVKSGLLPKEDLKPGHIAILEIEQGLSRRLSAGMPAEQLVDFVPTFLDDRISASSNVMGSFFTKPKELLKESITRAEENLEEVQTRGREFGAKMQGTWGAEGGFQAVRTHGLEAAGVTKDIIEAQLEISRRKKVLEDFTAKDSNIHRSIDNKFTVLLDAMGKDPQLANAAQNLWQKDPLPSAAVRQTFNDSPQAYPTLPPMPPMPPARLENLSRSLKQGMESLRSASHRSGAPTEKVTDLSARVTGRELAPGKLKTVSAMDHKDVADFRHKLAEQHKQQRGPEVSR